MKHITEYISRTAAKSDYLSFRKIWDRQASLALTKTRYASDPYLRLACSVQLAALHIPLDGRYMDQQTITALILNH